ncbi:MAG: hypothetical protein AVDCRST_MAG08-459, partial [uncultured Acetobacteraceae bacterium]
AAFGGGVLLFGLRGPAVPDRLATDARHLRRLGHDQRRPGGGGLPGRAGPGLHRRRLRGGPAAALPGAGRLRAVRGRRRPLRRFVQTLPLRLAGPVHGRAGGRAAGGVRPVLRRAGRPDHPDGRVPAAALARRRHLARHGGGAHRPALRAEHARRRPGRIARRLAGAGQRWVRGRARARRRAGTGGGGAGPDLAARPPCLGDGGGTAARRRRAGRGVALRRAAAVVRAGVPVRLRDRGAGDRVGAAAGPGRAVPRLPVPHRARRVPAGRRRRHRLRVAAGPPPARPAPRLLPGAGRRLRAGRGPDPDALAGAAALAAPELPPGGPLAARRAVLPRHDRADGRRCRAALLPDRHDLPVGAARRAAGFGDGGHAGRLGAARQHRRQRRRVGGHRAGVLAPPGHGRDAAAAGGAFPGAAVGLAVARRRRRPRKVAARAGAGAGRGLRRRAGRRAVQRGVLEPHARARARRLRGLGRGPLRRRFLPWRRGRARGRARPPGRAILHRGLRPGQHPVPGAAPAARRCRPVAAPRPSARAPRRRRQRRHPVGRPGLARGEGAAGGGDRRPGPDRAQRGGAARAGGGRRRAARRPADALRIRRRAPGGGRGRRAIRRDRGRRHPAGKLAQRPALLGGVLRAGAREARPRWALRAVDADPARGGDLRGGVPARGAAAAGQHHGGQRLADPRRRRGAPAGALGRTRRGGAPRARGAGGGGHGRAARPRPDGRLAAGRSARPRAADRHVPARRALREQRPRRGLGARAAAGAAGRSRRPL